MFLSLYYSLLSLTTLVVSFLMAIIVRSNNLVNKRGKNYIALTFITIGVCVIFEYTGVYLQSSNSDLILLHKVIKTVEYTLVPFIPYFFAIGINRSKLVRNLYLGLLTLHSVFQVVSACGLNLVFDISKGNDLIKGNFYITYIIVYIISTLIATLIIVAFARNYQYKSVFLIFIPLFFIVFSIVIQVVFLHVKLHFLNAAISAMALYITYLNVLYSSDAMTGLLNRQSYETKIKNMNRDCIIINLDLNNFKHINDTYGHSKGDEYIIKFAELLKKTYAKHGDCYRTGGDEFCVIITSDFEYLNILSKQLKNSVIEIQSQDPLMPGYSVGNAKFVLDSPNSIQEAVDFADQRMYQNKAYKKKYNKKT